MKITEVEVKSARIEMMPLIDSFFLILVYFIYAFLAMSVHKGVPLNLPKASTAVEQKHEHVGISITKDGTVYFDKKAVTKNELRARLQEARASIEAEDIYLYIYGDKEAAHGKVVEVFDMVRQSGIQKVFIETEN